MKICINCLLVEPGITGGGETFLVNLIARLARLDGDNEYLLLVTQANASLFTNGNPRFSHKVIMPNALARLRRIWFENRSLPRLLKRERVDLFYSPFGTLPRSLPCKSAVTFQNLLYIDFAKNTSYRGRTLASRLTVNLQALYYRMTTRSTLRRADKIWAVSNTTARALTDYYEVPAEKIEVIYEGVSYEQFNPGRGAEPTVRPIDSRYLLMVSSLYPNKNIDKAISAFRKVVDRGLPHQLVIVGNDWHQYRGQLEKLISKLRLNERVKFVGGVKHDEIPAYFKHADLFLMLSNVESFGLPVLEAMAAGVPVIISQRSSLPEIAGGAALTTDIQNVNHLADQMFRVLTDRSLAHNLRERGWSRARSFDWNETAARAIDLFNSIAGAPGTARNIHRKEVVGEQQSTRTPAAVR
ncbi:MAG: glycosyltransferase family 1 protein [Candidatus Zixiibacteriota bacterium]